jgi:hypothetical protein
MHIGNWIACSSLLLLGACSAVRTTADVAFAGASAVGKTVETGATVAKTTTALGLKAASTVALVGGASVSAAAAVRSAAATSASVAVAGAVAMGGAVKWGIEFSRSDDLEFAAVSSQGADRFITKEGEQIFTEGCEHAAMNAPAVLVTLRSGELQVRTGRTSDGGIHQHCKVLTINERAATP